MAYNMINILSVIITKHSKKYKNLYKDYLKLVYNINNEVIINKKYCNSLNLKDKYYLIGPIDYRKYFGINIIEIATNLKYEINEIQTLIKKLTSRYDKLLNENKELKNIELNYKELNKIKINENSGNIKKLFEIEISDLAKYFYSLDKYSQQKIYNQIRQDEKNKLGMLKSDWGNINLAYNMFILLNTLNIETVVNIGGSLYRQIYIIEHYFNSNKKIKFEYVPYSRGKILDLDKERLREEFYFNEVKFFENSINTCVNLAETKKVAFTDFIVTGSGIISFYILCLVFIIKNCENNIEKTKEKISKFVQNTYLILAAVGSHEAHKTLINLKQYLQNMGIKYNFLNNVYTITDLTSSNYVLEFGDDKLRCIKQYPITSWTVLKSKEEDEIFKNKKYTYKCNLRLFKYLYILNNWPSVIPQHQFTDKMESRGTKEHEAMLQNKIIYKILLVKRLSEENDYDLYEDDYDLYEDDYDLYEDDYDLYEDDYDLYED